MPDTARLTTALGDRYAIERELGAGGMATVYLANDLKHDREVALKVLRPELGAVLGAERFLAEIKITARLDHPHILTLIDSGAAAGFLYYVLPFVRGESLRDKLNREKQLGLEEALLITKQVAGALDYAHRQGVVHRDIKPENILIQEGEAMLTDFGIALAVKEAGGNRLTESGLSLGTPLYMSPEQATGERQLDARSDVYSLGAVLYEMLAGEPPVTGPTAQAIIAKLLTERPVHLRVVRESVPENVDAAVAKALDKTPADRFPGAGEFVRALEVRTPPIARGAAPEGRSRRLTPAVAISAVLGVAAVGVLGTLALTGKLGRRGPAFALRDRTQLTATGNVQTSAISPDGKQLAFVTKNCTDAVCSYAIDVQDVGGTTTHRILDLATAASGLEWSPDRRNLLFHGTLGGRLGTWVLSALGGPPRYVAPGLATFWAGGDSLLVAPALGRSDSIFQMRVTSIDGAGRDSIRVAGPGVGINWITVAAGGRWIIPLVIQMGNLELWQVMDRSGKVVDRVPNQCPCQVHATTDALWAQRRGSGSPAIVRIAIDPGSGRVATRADTLFSGAFNGFTVTADGSALVINDGTYENSVWALDLADALRGRFPEVRRLLRTSSRIGAEVSPDGARLLVRRTLPSSPGRSEVRLSTMPFDGGAETPLAGQGARVSGWADSVSVAVSTRTPRGLRLAVQDTRTGAELKALDLPDSIVDSFEPLVDGWAWIPATNDRVIVKRAGRTVVIPKPALFQYISNVSHDASSPRIVFSGTGGSFDTLGIAVAPLDGGPPVIWASMFADGGGGQFLDDGSILFNVRQTQESFALYRLRAPGRLERLGVIPRPIAGLSVSRDLRHAVVKVQDYHGDAWMHRVVRP
jgi:hypothetical protein